jgi:hypothetical protein
MSFLTYVGRVLSETSLQSFDGVDYNQKDVHYYEKRSQMPTINIKAQLSKQDLLEAVEQLSLSELEGFVQDIIVLKAKHHAPSLSKDETELLLKINQSLSPELQSRYQVLIDKRKEETLTEQEYQELIHLSDQVELHQAQRLEYLAQLAQLRQISLTDLMAQIGIKPIIHD